MTSERAGTKGTQKKAWLAVLLNLVPLVGVVDSIPDAIPLYNLFGITCFLPILLRLPLYLALVVWGMGYLYLRRFVRFAAALSIPWLYCTGYFATNSYLRPSSPPPPDFYLPYMAQGLVVFGIINLFTGIDAWFLARRNLDLGAGSGLAQETAQLLDDRRLRSPKTETNYIICPHCGMEQWKGYKECQKCRTHFG